MAPAQSSGAREPAAAGEPNRSSQPPFAVEKSQRDSGLDKLAIDRTSSEIAMSWKVLWPTLDIDYSVLRSRFERLTSAHREGRTS
jgi:hypothetical protein